MHPKSSLFCAGPAAPADEMDRTPAETMDMTPNEDKHADGKLEIPKPYRATKKDFPLPPFSSTVLNGLKRHEVDLVWNQVSAVAFLFVMLIACRLWFWTKTMCSLLQALQEAAVFFRDESRRNVLSSKSDYADLGAALSKNHPRLMKGGTMSTFTRALSGRLRSYR